MRTSAARPAGRRRQDRALGSVAATTSPTVSRPRSWAGTPKRVGEGDEVGAGQLRGGGLAERVGHVLAQDAVAAVVDDQPGDRQSCCRAVASSAMEYSAPPSPETARIRRPDPTAAATRGREGVAEAAGALRGMESRRPAGRTPTTPSTPGSSCPRSGEASQRARGRSRQHACSGVQVLAAASLRRPRLAGPARASRRRPGRGASPSPARADSARRASAWMPSAGWLDSSLPRSASIWITRPRGANVW